ncbi:hypothetical protein RRG08_025290 [Elysia crispata]|uniref:Uncharacterized protein n=1 Tax=Elysia crispata TaxID=231223 RepID=A0AAE1AGV3_9GAST|nr:hypothetical protein RRG08_025290 [Elysia crispata]
MEPLRNPCDNHARYSSGTSVGASQSFLFHMTILLKSRLPPICYNSRNGLKKRGENNYAKRRLANPTSFHDANSSIRMRLEILGGSLRRLPSITVNEEPVKGNRELLDNLTAPYRHVSAAGRKANFAKIDNSDRKQLCGKQTIRRPGLFLLI